MICLMKLKLANAGGLRATAAGSKRLFAMNPFVLLCVISLQLSNCKNAGSSIPETVARVSFGRLKKATFCNITCEFSY